MAKFKIDLEKFTREEVETLPFPVDSIIPQTKSMKMVDVLIRFEELIGECEATIRFDNIFLDENGTLAEAAYLELMAQTIAASIGYNALLNKIEIGEGFLLGAKKVKIFEKSKVGDKLRIKVFKDVQLGEFGIIQGTVFKSEKIVAQGELKVWAKNAG